MEAEQIIPTAMGRLKVTADDALKYPEESKDGYNGKVVRRLAVEWIRLAVEIVTEPLDKHEKFKILSTVLDELRYDTKAP